MTSSGNTDHRRVNQAPRNQFVNPVFHGGQTFHSSGPRTPEEECLRCLYTSDYGSHKSRNPKRVEGTLEWFVEHEKYRHWRQERKSSLLWVSADPGCGKSVLASFLVDELKSQSELCGTVCFFFFKDDNEEQKNATFALSALLHQLFTAKESLIKHARKDFDGKGAKFTQEFGSLWRIFQAATTDPDCGDVYCIIDGLDECEESTRKELIQSLVRICTPANSTSRDTNKSFPKFILTSRPYGKIERQLKEPATIRLKAEHETPAISADIELVINSEVEALGDEWDLTDNERVNLRDNLIKGADRTFLWVSLILKLLREAALASEDEFRIILTELPSDLDIVYEKILQSSRKPEMAKKILQIVVAAARPLTLGEMDIALAIRPGHKSIEDLRQYQLRSLETSVKDICGLFVKVIDSKIYLIHQTAKEFLIKRPTTTIPATATSLWKQSLCPIESSLTLAKSCIYYLLFTVFETEPLVPNQSWWKMTREINLYTGKHVFLEYAANHWAAHTQAAEIWEGQELSASALEVLNSGARRLLTWFLVYEKFDQFSYSHRRFHNVTGLAVASYIGLDAAVELLIEKGNDINGRHGLYGSALNAAAFKRHGNVVMMLLKRGAIVYLFGGEFQDLLQTGRKDFRRFERDRRRAREEDLLFLFAADFRARRFFDERRADRRRFGFFGERREAEEEARREERIAQFLENFCLGDD